MREDLYLEDTLYRRMAATRGAKIPSLIYGTAWKNERTQELVKQALFNGFTGVDTAAQVISSLILRLPIVR